MKELFKEHRVVFLIPGAVGFLATGIISIGRDDWTGIALIAVGFASAATYVLLVRRGAKP